MYYYHEGGNIYLIPHVKKKRKNKESVYSES